MENQIIHWIAFTAMFYIPAFFAGYLVAWEKRIQPLIMGGLFFLIFAIIYSIESVLTFSGKSFTSEMFNGWNWMPLIIGLSIPLIPYPFGKYFYNHKYI